MYTEIQRGSFTSTGANKYIPLVTDVDWMEVYNYTTINAGPAGTTATRFYWQRGMADNDGFVTLYNGAGTFLIDATSAGLAVPGFTLYNSGDNPLLSPVTVTGITSASPLVVATGTTTGLAAGDIVRLISTVGATQLDGIDFEIGAVTPSTSFTLNNTFSTMASTAASPGANAAYRKLKYGYQWSPSRRFITKITKGSSTIVTMSVAHPYKVGMKVRFRIPAVRGSSAWGMTELDNMIGTITAINASDGTYTNTITVDIDSSSFTTFVWPATTIDRFTAASVCVVGENSNSLIYTSSDDAVMNTAERGIILGAGAMSPAGVNNDVIYWKAGKSNI